jgi:hypothetical protein
MMDDYNGGQLWEQLGDPWVDDEFPCLCDKCYIIAIQYWIHQSCSSTCFSWYEMSVIFHFHEHTLVFIPTMMDIFEYSIRILEIALFFYHN